MSFRSDAKSGLSRGAADGRSLAPQSYRVLTEGGQPTGLDADHLFTQVAVPPGATAFALPIPGLELAPNALHPDPGSEDSAITWVHSQTDDVVGHFVTHGPRFEYQDFGTHVGQVDRLTFVATDEREIEAFFVDCRSGLATCGMRIMTRLQCSPGRKVVIPCGVAHSFRNLGGVVTRNDLSLLIAADNSQWNALNDNIVFPWSEAGVAAHPQVAINTIPMPLPLALGFYDLQRQSLAAPPGGHPSGPAPAGAGWVKTYCSPIGPDSWMVIPGTAHCAQSMCLVDLDRSDGRADFAPAQGTRLFTILECSVAEVRAEIAAPTGGAAIIDWPVDPRWQLRLDSGSRLCLAGRGKLVIRVEEADS